MPPAPPKHIVAGGTFQRLTTTKYPTNALASRFVASMRGAKKYLSEQLGKNIEIITPKLPGFVKPEDSSKASLLVMADNLSKFDFGAFIKKLFNGGKK